MDRAIVLENGRETIVFAEEYASGRMKAYARATVFRCPCCRQRLFFAEGKTQVPHFRHEKNNPHAKQCELYVAGSMGGTTPYTRVPPPLFIRQKVGAPGKFIVELGLKRPPDSLLASLEREGAVLSVANGMLRPREYKLTADCFASGWRKVPLRVGRGFSFSKDVRLTHSGEEFAAIWGMPEPIEDALFFSCDPQTLSGRRIGRLGRIAIGDSVLVASQLELDHFAGRFPDVEKVGEARACDSGSLNVFLATADGASAGMLEKYGVSLISRGDAPELLWPPALTSSGEARPLFSRSDYLYRVKQPNDGTGDRETLCAHTDTSVVAQQLEQTCGKQWMSACVRLNSDVTFISAREWGPVLAILLKCKENQRLDGLCESGRSPHIKHSESGEFEVGALSPCEVICLCRGGHIERYGLEPGAVQAISNEPQKLVRIALDAALGIHGNRVVFESIPDVVGTTDPCQETRPPKQPVGIGRDVVFARLRASLVRSIGTAYDHEFAAGRKA